jgi:uncharacterized protein YndB with AHSA1/START domain
VTPPDVSVRTNIAASPADVWNAVADPRRIVEWSPESAGVRCSTDGPLPVGARFSGSNSNGPWRWSTSCVVVESEPGRAFAFDVSFLGTPVARWRYEVTPTAEGVTVEEQWWDHRGAVMTALGVVGTGVRDRRSHNEAGMRATLARLTAAMEGRTPAG